MEPLNGKKDNYQRLFPWELILGGEIFINDFSMATFNWRKDSNQSIFFITNYFMNMRNFAHNRLISIIPNNSTQTLYKTIKINMIY